MMHMYFTHTQDKKSTLLGLITIRSILSRLSVQVQRCSHNVAKPSEYSDSTLTMERGEPSTHLDKSSGAQAMSFTTNLSKSEELNTSVHLTDAYYPLILTMGCHTFHRFPTHKRSSMNFHTSYSLPPRNGTQLSLTTSCPPNQTSSTSSRTILKMDTYVRLLLMLTGTAYVDILTRNPVLVTRRFSTRRSDLFLVSKPTTTMMTTPQ